MSDVLAKLDSLPTPILYPHARALALELSGIAGLGCAAVVLADPLTLTEVGRATVGPCAPLPHGSLLDLVLPTEPSICDVARLHDPALRSLARTWSVQRVLLAPCTFGHDLLAVAVAPLGDLPDVGAALRAARRVTERTAAAIMCLALLGDRPLAISA